MFIQKLYVEDMLDEWSPAIYCNPKIWQTAVLQACVILHMQNKYGRFYYEPARAGQGASLTKDAIYDWYVEPTDSEYADLTDHVIRLSDIWRLVEKQLTMLGVHYQRSNPDADKGLTQGVVTNGRRDVGFEGAIVVHINYLLENYFLIDLNTRRSHYDEASYKLNDDFFKALTYS